MKTLASTFIVALVVQAQALTFSWSSSAQVSFGDSLVSALNPNTYTATLVYLGADAVWGATKLETTGITLASGDIETGNQVTSNAGLTGMQARNNSRFGGSFQASIGSTTSGGYTVAAGDTFGVFLTYVDSTGKTWYNISSSTYKIPETANDLTQGLGGTFEFSSTMTEKANGSMVSSGSGWVAASVPEPSTAALALAGLALLLKRRKA